jgi:putative Mn2+ efflux pump MntP
MGLVEIIIIAMGLSMDTFAVSITIGLTVKKPKVKEVLIPGIYFAFFHVFMLLIGYFAGVYLSGQIQSIDHWIVFILLGLIGGKMIRDSLSKDKDKMDGNPFQFIKMLLLAIATSIDTLAVGITFAFFEIDLFKAITIIGLITFCISAGGVKVGNLFGTRFKSKAEFIGGAVLVILGLKILIEHLL